ncbi:MAG: SUMF1/EgtB/PvdO family nonheme iron enzyme [Chloroflexi bacterium]|nr:SUMF1/EgtB/PvdO family nonheme iron enzyme [Chloroflexota bacterium]
MDIPQLAAKVAEILIPFLTAGATAAASEMGKQAVAALWEKLKPKVEAKEAARDAMEFLREEPENPSARDSLERQIRKILVEYPSLAEEVGQIVQAGDDNVIVGGNVSGNNITIGKDITITHIYGEKTSSPPVSMEQLTHEYLQALAAECEKLPLGTIHVTLEKAEHEASISLEDVYIDLDIRPRARGQQKEKEMEAAEREPQRIPIAQALEDAKLRRVVLLGEAGSGKTTCVHYLTIALAAIQQNAIAKKPLPENSTLARYFPIRLILRDVAIPTDTKTGGVDILWNALRADLTKKIGKEQADQLFPHLQNRIKTTPCLIMLDGLDEVPESEERRPRLLEAIENFSATLKQSIVMVTARPYAYDNPKWHLPHFEILDLLDFSSEQIENFISRFYDSVQVVKNWDDALVALRKSGLNEAVQSREYLYKLAERPLLLTLIASVDSSGSQLPEGRAELYKETIDLLLQRWHLRKESSIAEQEIVRFFSTDSSKVLDILQKLAYKVHERQGRESKPKEQAPADIDRDEIWAAFSSSLPKEIDMDSLLNFLEKRAGLLLDRGEGIYVFPHRSFQEYLAAGFLNTQSDEKFHLDAIFHREPKWWREVVLLGIARMLPNLKNAADEVNTLVPCDIEKMEHEITPIDWQAAGLAGQALLEIRLKEKGGDQIKYKTIIKRIRNWLVQLLEQNALAPRERAEAGDTLAKLGDPRPGVTSDFLFCEIRAGKFLMGSKEGEKNSSDDERPQFEYNIPDNYFMSRYPITNAQFDLFVKDPNGYTKDEWWTEAGLNWRKGQKEHKRYSGAFSLPNHPVVGVTWYEAAAFCKWMTEKMKKEECRMQIYKPKSKTLESGDILHSAFRNLHFEIRLPTEAEWERAARGGTNYRYPWNNDEITPNHANYADTNLNVTSAVGAFPLAMNDYGLLDMSGNVWEWCATEWRDNYEGYLKKENNKPEGSVARVVRGGACGSVDGFLRCAYRGRFYPDVVWYFQGFRVVASFPISLPYSGS